MLDEEAANSIAFNRFEQLISGCLAESIHILARFLIDGEHFEPPAKGHAFDRLLGFQD